MLRVPANSADKQHEWFDFPLMAHKLLLADDSVTIQRVIELTFADEDVDVTTVGDGQLAIDRLESDPPDIVLADVDMPKRDGYEVAAYVKSRPKLAHIPVVLLTGAFEPIDSARAAAAGSSEVLAKPFEPQMVINRVKELLGKKRQDEADRYEQPPQAAFAPQQPRVEDPTPPGRQAATEGSQPVSLDDYFDQLDAAFSNVQVGTPRADDPQDDLDWPASPSMRGAPAGQSVAPAPSGANTPFAPAAPAAPSAPVAPVAPVAPRVSMAPPPQSRIEPLITPAAKPAGTAWPAPPLVPPPPRTPPVAPRPTVSQVPLSGGAASAPNAPIEKPAPPAPKPAGPPVPSGSATGKPITNPFASLSAAKAEAAARPALTDEVIEEIVTRVLQRLSDKVVRETVTELVSQTAERLVQEEIERIKAGS
jgi:CheY-like chemotaxis protein